MMPAESDDTTPVDTSTAEASTVADSPRRLPRPWAFVAPVVAVVLLAGACGSAETSPSAQTETAETETPGVAATAGVTVSSAAPAPATAAAPAASTAAAADTRDGGMSMEVQTIVSGLSAATGGLSAASRDCVVALLSEHPSLVDTLIAAGGPVAGPAMLRVLACLTADEAAALAPPGDGEAPDPAAIACLMEALSEEPSGERIVKVLTGADPSGEGLTFAESEVLGEAVASCGIETEFGFGDPSDAAGSLPDDGASVGGGWGLCSEWLILYPGDVCDRDQLTVTIENDGTVLLAGSIDGVDVDGMSFDGDIVDVHGLLMAYDGTAWTINALPQ